MSRKPKAAPMELKLQKTKPASNKKPIDFDSEEKQATARTTAAGNAPAGTRAAKRPAKAETAGLSSKPGASPEASAAPATQASKPAAPAVTPAAPKKMADAVPTQAMPTEAAPVAAVPPAAAQGPAAAAGTVEAISSLGRENIDACVESGASAAKGMADFGTEVMSFTRLCLESNISATQALFGARSLREFFDLQARYSQEGFENLLSESSKLTGLSFKVVKEASAPIQARAGATVEKILKSRAA